MSALYETKKLVVRDMTGAVVAGAVVLVYLETSGGRGPLASTLFEQNGTTPIDQSTDPMVSDLTGTVTFKAPAGVYWIEASLDADTYIIPGFSVGNASSRDVGFGANNLPAATQIGQAITGHAPSPADARRILVFNSSGNLVDAPLIEATPAGGSANMVLGLNAAGDTLAWLTLPSGALPALTGNAGRVLVVNDLEDAAEWVEPPELVYPTFAGNSGRVLAVNAAGTDVEWVDPRPPYAVSALTTRDAAASDHNRILQGGESADATLTLPTDATSIPVGTMFTVTQIGSFAVTITPASGVSINGLTGGGAAKLLREAWSAVTVYKSAANAWVVAGDYVRE